MVWVKKTFDKKYMKAFEFLDKKSNMEVKEIVKLLNITKRQSILDTCCGWGRHVCKFYKKGYKIKGIDLSDDFLNHARKKCKKELFIKKDIRKIDYKNQFDIILNLETSFGYYSDKINKLILRKIHRALKKDGQFLLDMVNPTFIIKNFKDNLILFNKKDVKIKDINKLIKNKSIIETKRIIELNNNYYEKKIVLRLYEKNELLKILKEIGFRKIRFFGNLNGDKYSKNSPRLVIISQR